MSKSMQMALTIPKSGSIESYIQSVSNIPMLTADEEK